MHYAFSKDALRPMAIFPYETALAIDYEGIEYNELLRTKAFLYFRQLRRVRQRETSHYVDFPFPRVPVSEGRHAEGAVNWSVHSPISEIVPRCCPTYGGPRLPIVEEW